MELVLNWSLWAVTGLLVVAALIPFLKIKYGFVRGFDFPREQMLLAASICVPIFLVLRPAGWGWGIALAVAVVAIHSFFIVKFTPIWSRQSVDANDQEREETDRHVSLLASNIKKSNRDYDGLIDLVRDRDPDIVMVIEVDDKWIDALKGAFENDFEHWVDVPMDNGYGLCLMSRLKLSEIEVRELITESVPSIRTAVTLRDGRQFRLYVVHPEPPTLSHDTHGRDSEIAMVGLEANRDPLPAVVSGDLNDVAWSTTTRRFQRLSRMLDPRVGRGFYNTFSATIPLMRWPLDHLFHDPAFRVIEMDRERKVGSDHFPMWFVLALADTQSINTDPGTADVAEVVEAKREIVNERKRDREAIGSDWEDED